MPDVFDQIETGKRRDVFDEIGEELSDSNPPFASESGGPHHVPAELQQFAEQAAIEQKPYWPTPSGDQPQNLSDLMSGRYGRDVQIPENIRVPTMAETGAIPAEAFKAYLTYANPVGLGVVAAEKIWPEATAPKIGRGAIEGTSEALAGFTTPENLASLAVMPQSKIAQVMLNLGLGGMAASQLPAQIKAYGATDDPEEKAKIATGIGVSLGLPALGVAHSFRRAPSPKVVEPVKTTQETAKIESESLPETQDLQSPQATEQFAQDVVASSARTPQANEKPSVASQPESISPAVEEARPIKFSYVTKEGRTSTLEAAPNEAMEALASIRETGGEVDAINGRIVGKRNAEELIQESLTKAPIQPGIESALAEIQRRNTPAEISDPSRPPSASIDVPAPRARDVQSEFREPPTQTRSQQIDVQREQVSPEKIPDIEGQALVSRLERSSPENTLTSTRKATTFAEPGISKIGKSIEAKAVEAKLTQGFEGTANFDPITIKDQAQRATGLIKSSLDNARAVIRGEVPLPEGLRGTSLITAMEEHMTRHPNADLAYELANSPLVRATSEAAQEMRLMAERVPDSITSAFQEIREARRAGSKQRGETPERVVQEIKAEVVRNSSKRPTWEAFVKSIECPV